MSDGHVHLHWTHDYTCQSCGNGWSMMLDHEDPHSTMPCPFCQSPDQRVQQCYETTLFEDVSTTPPAVRAPIITESAWREMAGDSDIPY